MGGPPPQNFNQPPPEHGYPQQQAPFMNNGPNDWGGAQQQRLPQQHPEYYHSGMAHPSEVVQPDYMVAQQQQQPPPPQAIRIEPQSQVRVLYDYVATEKNALSLRAGELATLIENYEHGWCTVRMILTGKEGYFPVSYLEVIAPPPEAPPASAASAGAGVAGSHSQIRCILHGKMRSSGNMTTELDPATGGATIRWVCKAGCECKGPLLQNVAMWPSQPGSTPAIGPAPAAGGSSLLPRPAGEAAGLLGASPGAARPPPLMLARPVAPSGAPPPAVQMGPSSLPMKQSTVLADYTAAGPGVLSLKAGEVCLVVHPDNQGWTFVTAASGQQGHFPSSYLSPPCFPLPIPGGGGGGRPAMLLPGGPVPIRFPVTHTFPILSPPDRPSGEGETPQDAASSLHGGPPGSSASNPAGGGALHSRPKEECRLRTDGEKLAAAAEAVDGCKPDGEELDGPAKKRGRTLDGAAATLGEEKAASTVVAAGEESAGLAVAPVLAVEGGGEPAAAKQEDPSSEPQAAKEAEMSAP